MLLNEYWQKRPNGMNENNQERRSNECEKQRQRTRRDVDAGDRVDCSIGPVDIADTGEGVQTTYARMAKLAK